MGRKTINKWTLDKSPVGKMWRCVYNHANERLAQVDRNTITVLAKVYYNMLEQYGPEAAQEGLRLIVSGNYYNQR